MPTSSQGHNLRVLRVYCSALNEAIASIEKLQNARRNVIVLTPELRRMFLRRRGQAA